MDKKYGTNYAANVEAYRKHLQKNDLSFAMGLTDVKGDRSLRPSQQVQHKDFYVRIVEERPDGIIVSGAKTHISQAPACNEILIAPCRAMQEDDKAYAVAFGIDLNTPGITMICAQPEIHEGAYAVRPSHLGQRLHQRRHHHLRQRLHPQRAHLPQRGVGVRRAKWPTCSPTSIA